MTATLEATIHGRTFRLAAPDADREALAEAIKVVEAECALISQKQPGAEIERVLLLAALELAATKPVTDIDPRVESRLQAITANLRRALNDVAAQ